MTHARTLLGRALNCGGLLAATALLCTGAEGLIGRFERIMKRRMDAGHTSAPREATPNTLRPGDAIMAWNGDDRLVQTVLECAEHVNGRETDWRWLLLDGNTLLEVAPSHTTYYNESDMIYQGSLEFLRLVGDQDGLLRVFEARVRDGSLPLNPVTFEHGGASYQINSTGTFVVGRSEGAALAGEVWRDITPNEGDNVYVKLTGPQGSKLLGIWTTHIALLKGQEVGPGDLRCYGQ